MIAGCCKRSIPAEDRMRPGQPSRTAEQNAAFRAAESARPSGVRLDRSKYRRIVVTLYPAGFIGLRLEKCRREETLSIRGAYETAVHTRVMHELAARR
jgi:hypothetical protein